MKPGARRQVSGVRLAAVMLWLCASAAGQMWPNPGPGMKLGASGPMSYDARYYGTFADFPTPDSQRQTVHPSVIDMMNDKGATWNGHRYWAAYTPYTNTNDQVELPCVAYSDNKTSWSGGAWNPLQSAPGSPNHYDDPHLVYNAATDELWVYYLYTTATDTTLYLQKSADGVTWTAKTAVYSAPGQIWASPAVVRKSATDWWLFYILNSDRSLNARRSADGVTWGAPETVSATATVGSYFWHMDAHWNATASRFEMLSFDTYTVTYKDTGALHAYTSADGLTWTSVSAQPLVDVLAYRPAFIYNGDGTIDLWYAWHHHLGSTNIWAMEYRPAVPQPFDGYQARTQTLHWSFEGNLENLWSYYPGTTSVSSSSTQFHDGTKSLRISSTGNLTLFSYLPQSAMAGKKVTAWFYDDNAATRYLSLSLRYVSTTADAATYVVAAQIYTGLDATHYVTGTYAPTTWTRAGTSVSRSAGWHKVEFTITDATHIAIAIDGTTTNTGLSLVGGLPQFFTIDVASGFNATYYVDDISVQ